LFRQNTTMFGCLSAMSSRSVAQAVVDTRGVIVLHAEARGLAVSRAPYPPDPGDSHVEHRVGSPTTDDLGASDVIESCQMTALRWSSRSTERAIPGAWLPTLPVIRVPARSSGPTGNRESGHGRERL
jgi:hypothetical protein